MISIPSPLRGFTLLEMLVAVAIAGIVAAGAVPSLQQLLDRRRVEGHASQLAADLHFARFDAVTRNRLVRFSVFGRAGGGTCYLVHTGMPGGCRCAADGVTSCEDGANPLRVVAFAADSGLWVESNVASLSFDPLHGTSTPAGVLQLRSVRGLGVQHVVNVMGRIRSCPPRVGAGGSGTC